MTPQSVRKTRVSVLSVAFLAVLGIARFAGAANPAPAPANIAGNWVFEQQAGLAVEGRGPTAATNGMVIQQTGDKIKGTLTVPRGGDSPFEGKVDGNNVQFTVKRKTVAGDVSIDYKGIVTGDSMKGTYRVTGQMTGTDVHWVAMREKAS